MTDSVRVFAPAKINLFLHVGEKRADGYHALQSLAVFAQAGDELELHRSGELALSVCGPFADGLAADKDNLVLKAGRLLRAQCEHHSDQEPSGGLRYRWRIG